MKNTKYYGFCKIKDWKDLSEDRVLLPYKGRYHLSVGIYVAIDTEVNLDDFYRIDEIPFNFDTDSFQIRVKAVFKNNKGYYIKLKGKREYLDELTVKSMKAVFKL